MEPGHAGVRPTRERALATPALPHPKDLAKGQPNIPPALCQTEVAQATFRPAPAVWVRTGAHCPRSAVRHRPVSPSATHPGRTCALGTRFRPGKNPTASSPPPRLESAGPYSGERFERPGPPRPARGRIPSRISGGRGSPARRHGISASSFRW